MSDSIESLVGERARDEQGRYKSVTPAEEPAPKEVSAPVEVKQEITPEPVVAAPVAPAPVVVASVEPVETEKERAYKRGMQEEREKRQRMEAELRELKAAPKTPVDPWSDLPGALKSTQEQLREEMFVERCNLTEETLREKHADFDEVRAVFIEAANANPTLWAQIRQERNPAKFVYREGLRIKELKDVGGDFGAYKSKLETDLRTKLEAEYAAKYGAKPAPVVPASLNSDGSPPPVEVYQGPKPLNQILRNASRR